MIQLALIRHGHTPWNRLGQIQGRSDIALDLTAQDELKQLALPAPWDKAQLWASPLKRATETARLISGRTPQTSAALVEMNWGAWEGQRGLELRSDPTSGFRDIEHWGWDYRPPQGETPAEIWTRLAPWVEALNQDTVAVCHIGIMRVILARAYGWDFSGPAPFTIKRNRLYVVDIKGLTLTPWSQPIRLSSRGAQ